jgi:hypothetical protein
LSGSLEKIAHIPMTKSTLNTALPTMVPKPTSEGGTEKVPMSEVKSSGADPPAAYSTSTVQHDAVQYEYSTV